MMIALQHQNKKFHYDRPLLELEQRQAGNTKIITCTDQARLLAEFHVEEHHLSCTVHGF